MQKQPDMRQSRIEIFPLHVCIINVRERGLWILKEILAEVPAS